MKSQLKKNKNVFPLVFLTLAAIILVLCSGALLAPNNNSHCDGGFDYFSCHTQILQGMKQLIPTSISQFTAVFGLILISILAIYYLLVNLLIKHSGFSYLRNIVKSIGSFLVFNYWVFVFSQGIIEPEVY